MPDNSMQNTALCLKYAIMNRYKLKKFYPFNFLCIY